MLTIVPPDRPLPITLWGTAPGPYIPREPVLGLVRRSTVEASHVPTPRPRMPWTPGRT